MPRVRTDPEWQEIIEKAQKIVAEDVAHRIQSVADLSRRLDIPRTTFCHALEHRGLPTAFGGLQRLWERRPEEGAVESIVLSPVHDLGQRENEVVALRHPTEVSLHRTRLVAAIADTHFGERTQLYQSYRATVDNLVAMVKEQSPSEIVVVMNGDATAGRGVFRGQETVIALPLAGEQVYFAAWEIKDLVERLADACGLEPKAIQVIIVLGHHDHSNKENNAVALVWILRAMQITAKYGQREILVNAGAEGEQPFNMLFCHGFGYSSYYAQSYAQIRAVWQQLVDRDRKSFGPELIWRVVVAHSHWLNISYVLAPERYLDTLGGFTRQERLNLPTTSRRVGMLTYFHDGEAVTIQAVEPPRELLDQEIDDPALHFRNGMVANERVLEVIEWLESQDMI